MDDVTKDDWLKRQLEILNQEINSWPEWKKELVINGTVTTKCPACASHAAAVDRVIELIEAEREPRKGILDYENACNHAINIIRRELGREEKK